MRRFFRRYFNKSAGNNYKEPGPPVAPSSPSPPSAPDTHLSNAQREGPENTALEHHKTDIPQPHAQSKRTHFEEVRIDDISLHSPRAQLVQMPGPDPRQAIEGNLELASLPLHLPTTYKYKPLPKGHIRFLRCVGMGSHPLAFLETHSLDDPPQYTAISYCWDPTSPKRTMFLDHTSFSISETVLEVLNQLVVTQVGPGLCKLFWIDQICINQDDQSEKLDQIYRMNEIYSKAEKVFIWLGPTANRSDHAFDNGEQMLKSVMDLNQATFQGADVPDSAILDISKDCGQLYGHLFLRPWFRRLWTVQEALLARKLVVMCGCREINFEFLVELAYQILFFGSLDVIRVAGASDEHMNKALTGIINLHSLRLEDASTGKRLQELDIEKFRDMVTESRSRQVSLAPDRVHALMGVAPRRVREYISDFQKFQPNQSHWKLYIQLAKCVLENDPEWYFLSLAPSKDRPEELPTWVPNLSSERPYASTLGASYCGYSAGISQKTEHLVKRTITAEEIVARGFRLGIVNNIIPQTAFTEETQTMKQNYLYGAAASAWSQKCFQLDQELYNLHPLEFSRSHISILLAESATNPAMGGLEVDGYRMFRMAGRVRYGAMENIKEGICPIPERFASLPDMVDQLADHIVKMWQRSLSVAEYGLLVSFSSVMARNCAGRPYISTNGGFTGLGCPNIQKGDMIYIIYGTTVPYVLRPRPDGAFSFVGDAYVYDCMNGNALLSPSKGPDEMVRIR